MSSHVFNDSSKLAKNILNSLHSHYEASKLFWWAQIRGDYSISRVRTVNHVCYLKSSFLRNWTFFSFLQNHNLRHNKFVLFLISFEPNKLGSIWLSKAFLLQSKIFMFNLLWKVGSTNWPRHMGRLTTHKNQFLSTHKKENKLKIDTKLSSSSICQYRNSLLLLLYQMLERFFLDLCFLPKPPKWNSIIIAY